MSNQLDAWDRIFGGRGGAYMFTMSNVAISSEKVEQTYENGRWVLKQSLGSTYTARSQHHVGAVLLLIAARMGLRLPDGVDFEDTPDTTEDGP